MTTNDDSVDLEQVLSYFKELVGNQAQEIAVLTALVAKLRSQAASVAGEPYSGK